jgi:protein-S-isoprenylcysteine O-methyltransferase Ste14
MKMTVLTICHWWIVGLWTVLLVYWTIAAILVGRGLRAGARRRGMGLRLVLLLIIIAAIDLARRFGDLRALEWAVLHSEAMALAGAILTTVGAVIAFTARAAIGRNWGPPATERSDTLLVTSGPYSLVRHPIYTGILLMMIGTAIGIMPAWLLVAIAAGIYFYVSARAEERFMAERFPEAYPPYRARTKMLIPFLL